MAGEPSLPPSPAFSPGKHRHSPDDANPGAFPKRRRHYRHRYHHRLVKVDHAAADDEVEEGEILDDAAAAVDFDADAQQHDPTAPESVGNHADLNLNVDAAKLPSHSSSKDEWESNQIALQSKSGGVFSSDTQDTREYEQSQRVSKSPQPRMKKGRECKDEHHTSFAKELKDHSRRSPSSSHHTEAHSKDHSRSRGTCAEASDLRTSRRNDSDCDSSDRIGKSNRHAVRSLDNKREKSSSRVVHDVHDDRHDSRERYRDERWNRSNILYRDKVDSHEVARRTERSISYSRSDRRESTHHNRDESSDCARLSVSSRHRDHERRRDTSKDHYKESDSAGVEHKRERVRDDNDRGRQSDMEKETHRTGEGNNRVRNSDRHRNSTRSKHSLYDGHKYRSRCGEKGRDVNCRSQGAEETKENIFRKEDENKYQEKIEQQLAMQEEDDPEKIKEEARRRKEAIIAKYKQQQLQKRHLEFVDTGNNKEAGAMGRDETADLKDDNGSDFVANEEVENKHDSSDALIDETGFDVGKSPAHIDALPTLGTLGNERTTGVSVLGEGTPKSERSVDMFCDDIFGESPAGIRKLGKDDLRIEKNGLHDNWDDAEGYYTYRFGELLDGRYEITAAHGKGVFSTVVRAKDLKAGKDDPGEVAIKIIRNNETMYKTGKQEVSILEKLASADPEDKRHCVRFISSFMYRNHICLVFESLNMNLRELLKKFGRNIGLKLTAVRAYSKQLFIALKHLKNRKVLHCDIKPDNMLVNEAKNVLKLCDFGNAMFAGMNEATPYLVSRFYRAPEIILGFPYDHPLDMWSVGCCLYEFYTGEVLFKGASNNKMLRLHMELKGPFPKKMLRKGAFTMQHFDQDLNFHATEEDPVTKKDVRKLMLNIKPKDIGYLISNFPGDDRKMLSNFKDLLEKIFILDPEKRITVSQALSHPFITGK